MLKKGFTFSSPFGKELALSLSKGRLRGIYEPDKSPSPPFPKGEKLA
jgi:hypothetical protein